MEIGQRLVVASNRLPVEIKRVGENWHVAPVAGGLVTALTPIMTRNRGLWIGWPGCSDDVPVEDLLHAATGESPYDLRAVVLTREEEEGYYRGFANESIWPLFHDLLGHCRFDLENFRSYMAVNRRFAEAIAQSVDGDSMI
ncbi:MAG TPA: trehalose-6-phosphate synthase, partial [candidate division Zixibacteria bacterium]|nr:trehalose-6-phosphate synthase [candidate division Zixibacteria bacterium]